MFKKVEFVYIEIGGQLFHAYFNKLREENRYQIFKEVEICLFDYIYKWN